MKPHRRSLAIASLVFLLSLSAHAQPAVLEAGMTPNQSAWAFETPLDKVNKQVKFFMRVQREGNLSRFGTFDYYYRIQVTRPDGVEIWNDLYGFDEKGYCEREFWLPSLFWERSADRNNPSFGIWKIRMSMEEKDSKKSVAAREFNMNFTDGRDAPKHGGPAVLEVGMNPNGNTWIFNPPMDAVNRPVKFFMKVQRQGNLSRFGTFDYYFRVRVVRPDRTEVWNESYGFDEQGYCEKEFWLPSLFYERSADKMNPSFGAWKISVALEEKDSKKTLSSKEWVMNFVDGRKK